MFTGDNIIRMKPQLKLVLSGAFMLVLLSATQNISSDLMQIRNRYANPAGELSYKLIIHYYDLKDLKHVQDSSFGEFYIAKGQSYAEIEDVVSITNEKYNLSIDKQNQRIFISRNIQKSREPDLNTSFLDSVFNSNKLKIIDLKPEKKGNKKFRIGLSEGSIDSIDIEYNPALFLMHSVMIYYQRTIDQEEDVKPVAKFIYYNQKSFTKPDNRHFDISKYVQIDGKQVTLRSEYKSYRLINNLKF